VRLRKGLLVLLLLAGCSSGAAPSKWYIGDGATSWVKPDDRWATVYGDTLAVGTAPGQRDISLLIVDDVPPPGIRIDGFVLPADSSIVAQTRAEYPDAILLANASPGFEPLLGLNGVFVSDSTNALAIVYSQRKISNEPYVSVLSSSIGEMQAHRMAMMMRWVHVMKEIR